MKGGKYFALLVILFINIFTLIKMGLRVNFLSELLLIVLFLIASLIILYSVFKEREYGLFITILFLVSLINLFYIRHMFIVLPKINAGMLGRLLFGVNMLGNTIGFLIGITSIKKQEDITEEEKEEIIGKDIEPKIEEMDKKIGEQTKEEPWDSVVEAYYPGKFLASKKSIYYHAPKCDWAKRINKKNRVWLKGKAEAKKKGYKAHSCLKKK
ncbi:MAG: hypothetical protein KAU20_06335 [Nanoarchaeota archaeon]|nr:hypothetical protein [Nanoarchaeota archaeon]